MKIVTLSSKYQITIPKSFLTKLQVLPKSRLLVEAEKDMLTVKPLKTSIVEQTAGSLKKYIHPSKLGVPFLRTRRETQKIVARKLAEKYE